MSHSNVPALARAAAGPLALWPGAAARAEEAAARWLAAQSTPAPAPAAPCALFGVQPVFTRDALVAVGQGWRPYAMAGAVAVIPVEGLIVPEAGMIGLSWFTGCAELAWQVATALADPDVAALALWVDSPGGMVARVDETAAAIRAARAVKPVAAVAAGGAYSAAYWLASAADTISATRTGGVGHIGVIAEHWDDSAFLERVGIARTVVAEGARKGDGHPHLTPEGLAALRAEVADLRDVFAASVAEGRRGRPDAAAVIATQSRAYTGPAALSEALSVGLIDAILPADEALSLWAGQFTAG